MADEQPAELLCLEAEVLARLQRMESRLEKRARDDARIAYLSQQHAVEQFDRIDHKGAQQ